jgi:DNA-binding response OmpR family regulator
LLQTGFADMPDSGILTLKKPFAIEELARAIAAVMRR